MHGTLRKAAPCRPTPAPVQVGLYPRQTLTRTTGGVPSQDVTLS